MSIDNLTFLVMATTLGIFVELWRKSRSELRRCQMLLLFSEAENRNARSAIERMIERHGLDAGDTRIIEALSKLSESQLEKWGN